MTETSQSVYQTPAYHRSRVAYRLECAFEYFVALLVGSAFLATLLKHLGMDDAQVGILSSVISLAFLFQLFSVFVVQHITNTKVFAILFHSISQLFFMGLYLIPFMPFATEVRHVLAIVFLLLAYFGNYFVTSMIYKWGNSFVDPHKRGSFGAGKEMLSLISGVVVTLVVGAVMDAYKANNDPEGGFLFSAIAILIFCICDFVCLLLIKNEKKPKPEARERVTLREVMKNTLGKKRFRHVVLLTVIYDVARYSLTGFLGTYMTNSWELGFSLGAVSAITMVGTMARFFLSKPFGRYSDRRTYAKGLELGLIMMSAAFLVCIFTAPSARYLIVVYMILYHGAMAGNSGNMLNLVYSYVDEKYFVQASAIKNSIGGLCGFLASILAGRLLAAVQENGNRVLGIPMYGQQLLAIIAFALSLSAVLYTRFVIEKQKVMLQ